MDPDQVPESQIFKSDEAVRLSAPDAASLIGKVIAGKYEIVSLLGEGGMSSVFQAKDLVINRTVALKILLSLRTADERAILRFQQEAKAAGRLNHPNIVQLYDVGTHTDGTPYLVMDYVPGETLTERLRSQGQLATWQALKFFVQVCDALGHAHKNGVIHRDIKPSNLLITTGPGGSELIKILDFGIAKVWDEALSGQQTTRTGEVFGSPLYMSPEQAVGTKVDFRSDIYSTGCALFESLSGLPPHVGETTLSTILKHQNDKAPSLREASLGRDFPADLEEVVAKSLSKNPEDRYQSMSEFSAALSSVIRTMDSGSLVKKPIVSSASGKTINASAPKEAKQIKVKESLVTAVLVATSVGLLAYVMWGKFAAPLNTMQTSQKGPSIQLEHPTHLSQPAASEPTALPNLPEEKPANPDAASLLPDVSTSDPLNNEYDQEIADHYRDHPDESELRLKNFHISAAGLKTLSKFKSLRKMNLTDATFNDLTPEWAKFSKLPLAIFSATNTKLSDKGLLTITKIPSLRDLNLGNCPDLTDESMKDIPHLKLLNKIEAPYCKFTDKGLALMVQAENLENLNLEFNRYIHGAPLVGLTKLSRFDEIKIGGTAITDATLAPLGNCAHLRVLNVLHTKISDASVPTILKLKDHLRILTLDETDITDAGIKKLAPLELKQLRVEKCPHVTQAVLNEFRKKHPNCTVWDDLNPYVSEKVQNKLLY
ncbi:MAG: protein kinase [Cyanobacteria bacterium SZAS-4]|nr:protein kinase [Cyanobacteria bacterium SZAS-4]